mmetsp:Transcript_19560/g.35845  ORF Transcript_19560/g.35845 Transcript_19560/m.35845 type:complete len:376 (-) Transcript_19560:716-1843(-)
MYRALGQSRCTIQLSVHAVNSDTSFDGSRSPLKKPSRPDLKASLRATGTLLESISEEPARETKEYIRGDDFINKELRQKQEMVNRLLRETDEKSDALKLTASEIVDLRRQVKLLQSENANLRRQLNEEEAADVEKIVSREVERMSNEDLKGKVIKLAQMYRNERRRGEEYERLLKSAQEEMVSAYKLKAERDKLILDVDRVKKANTQQEREIRKVGSYRETIRKQEVVISKLEGLLKAAMRDTQQARETALERDRYKTENLELRRQVRNTGAVSGGEIGDDMLKQEVRRLERQVFELEHQLKSKRPITSQGDSDLERRMIELEVELQRSELRVDGMQQEMDANAVRFAQEMSRMQGLLAERQSLIDTMQADYEQV